MYSIRWESGGLQIQLGYRGHGGGDVAPLAVRDIDHARRLLGFDADNIWRLRALLASGDDVDVSRLSDHAVTDRVAQLVAAQRLELRQWPRHSSGSEGADATGAASAAAGPAPPSATATPSALAPRPGAASTSTAGAAAAEASESAPEFAPGLQQRQARTLRRAAKEGAPFCEICEQTRALRQAAASGAGF